MESNPFGKDCQVGVEKPHDICICGWHPGCSQHGSSYAGIRVTCKIDPLQRYRTAAKIMDGLGVRVDSRPSRGDQGAVDIE